MVAKVLNLDNLSWQRQRFASSMMEERATVLFLSAIMHRKVIHVIFVIFSAMFAGPQTVEISKFCYFVNVM